MKICLLINSLGRGGAEKIVCDFAEFYSSNGIETTVLTTDNEKEVNFVSEKVKKDILYSKFSYPSKFILLSFFMHIFRFKSYLKKEKIDVTLSFLTRSNLLNITAGFFSKRKIYIYERSILSKIYSKNVFLKNIILKITINLYKFATKIFVLSEYAKEDLICHGVNANNIFVIPNPFEEKSNYTHQLKRGLSENSSISISTCSRLIKSKNVDVLINVIDHLNKTDSDFKFSLKIIGDGGEMQALKNLVKRKKLQNTVFFYGWVDSPMQFLLQSDIFLFASEYEGFGNVILEAMSARLPIIAFNSQGGVSDILDNGKYGITLADCSVQSFSDAVLKLCKDDISYRFYSEASLSRIKYYSMDKISSKLLMEIK